MGIGKPAWKSRCRYGKRNETKTSGVFGRGAIYGRRATLEAYCTTGSRRAGVAELVDAADSKSAVLTDMSVRVRPPAPNTVVCADSHRDGWCDAGSELLEAVRYVGEGDTLAIRKSHFILSDPPSLENLIGIDAVDRRIGTAPCGLFASPSSA